MKEIGTTTRVTEVKGRLVEVSTGGDLDPRVACLLTFIATRKGTTSEIAQSTKQKRKRTTFQRRRMSQILRTRIRHF